MSADAPPTVTWTDRGFRWVVRPAHGPGMAWLWTLVMTASVIVGLVGGLAAAVLLESPAVLVVGLVLPAGLFAWSISRTLQARPPGWLELDGPTVRVREAYVLVELALERLTVERRAGDVLDLSDGTETITVSPREDAAWIERTLCDARDRWVAHRSGAIPDGERAALARLTEGS